SSKEGVSTFPQLISCLERDNPPVDGFRDAKGDVRRRDSQQNSMAAGSGEGMCGTRIGEGMGDTHFVLGYD
ncbi:unnamed protein product, partial [Ilex paraguariensis]